MPSLLNKIKQKNVTIGIIGLGYVGLPLAIRFVEVGFKVIGFDIDDSKVKMLNNGKSYIKHINEGDISGMVEQGFIATTDFAKISLIVKHLFKKHNQFWVICQYLMRHKVLNKPVSGIGII